jgi:hypothetical protein
MKTHIPAAVLRQLSVEAEVDPRTLLKAYHGQPVRGMAGVRASRALAASGYGAITAKKPRKGG